MKAKKRFFLIIALVALALLIILVACDKKDSRTSLNNAVETVTETSILAVFHNSSGPDADNKPFTLSLTKTYLLQKSVFVSDYYDFDGIVDYSGEVDLFDIEKNRWLVDLFDDSFLAQCIKIKQNQYRVDLYCKWLPKEITVSMKSDKSATDKNAELKLAYGSDLPAKLTVPAPADSDYRFVGWYNGNTAVTDEFGNVSKTAILTSNYNFEKLTLKLEARYAIKTAHITFEYDITGLDPVEKDFSFGYLLTKQDYPAIKELEGQEPVGWSLSSFYYEPITEALREEEITLYALWRAYRTIEFFDGENLIDSIRVYNNGESVTHDAVKKGYRLEGWYNNEALSGNPVRINYGVANKLYARWEETQYTVTFVCDEKEIAPITYRYGENISFESLQKNGYRFNGWVRQDATDETVFTGTKDLACDLILVPSLTPNKYPVNCYANGTKFKTTTITYDSVYELGVPQKTGYVFIGWYASELSDETAYTDGSGIATAPWTIAVNGEIAMYAHFDRKLYKVNYESNGGSAVNTQSYYYGDSLDFPNDPTNSSDFFIGWYLDPELTKPCANKTVVEKDMTLYARWDQGKYITTVDDLRAVSDEPDLYYKLACDIDLGGAEWTPIEIFNGTLNGDGHSISNFKLKSAKTENAFIVSNNGTIFNITFKNVNVEHSFGPSSRAAVLVCRNSGFVQSVSLTDVSIDYVQKTAKDSNEAIGALCAINEAEGVISDVTIDGMIDIWYYLRPDKRFTDVFYGGAVVGYNYGTLSDAVAKVKIDSEVDVAPGSAVGYQYVYGCVGGLDGYNESTGKVKNGRVNVVFSGKYKSVYASFNYIAYWSRYGGAVGHNKGTCEKIAVFGSIEESRTGNRCAEGDQFVGGVVGLNDGTLIEAFSDLTLNAVNEIKRGSIGGICGQIGTQGLISSSEFAGSLKLNRVDCIAGICGYNYGKVKDSYSHCSIKADNAHCYGQLVGCNDSAGWIQNNLSGQSKSIGIGNGTISNNYVMTQADTSTMLNQNYIIGRGILSSNYWGVCDGLSIYLKAFADHEHNYGDTPICLSRFCTIPGCGYAVASIAEHSYIEYTFNNNATCTEDGTETASCAYGCGQTHTRVKEGSALGHSVSKYTFNNDATCTTDGTETGTCSVCDKTATRTKPNTAKGHYFIKGKCIRCDEYSPELIDAVKNDGFFYVDADDSDTCNAGDYVYCGYYPQSAKSPEVTLSSNMNEQGYFAGDDGNSYFFDNGVYYLIEPIKWIVLSYEDGKATLVANDVLDVSRWQENVDLIGNDYYNTSSGTPLNTYANNYEYSSIRAFLNGDFYDMAFTDAQKGLILSATVDNSARSANPDANATAFNGGVNDFACSLTEDKVFLLSEKEVTSAAYGFSEKYGLNDYDSARQKKATDYAVEKGATVVKGEAAEDFAIWWLRSALYSDSSKAVSVSYKARGAAPADAVEYNGHLYKRINTEKTWSEAKAYCESIGGHLATITSAGEDAFLRAMVPSASCWIGGSDAEKEGTWKWVTGEPWSYSKWGSGEPNNDGEEDGLEIGIGSWFWNDNKTDTKLAFICEWERPNGDATNVNEALGIVPAIVLKIAQ